MKLDVYCLQPPLEKVTPRHISGDGLLEGRDLILRNIPRDVLAVFPSLMVVVGALRSLPQNAGFTPFHVLDLGDLLQE